eukprot:g6365.t1
MTLTSFTRMAYDICEAPSDNPNIRKTPIVRNRKKQNKDGTAREDAVSIPQPTMRFLRQLTEAFVSDQFRMGMEMLQKVKEGKKLGDSITNGNCKLTSFLLENGTPEELDESKGAAAIEDGAVDEEEQEALLDDEEQQALNEIDDAYFEEYVSGRSFSEVLTDMCRSFGGDVANETITIPLGDADSGDPAAAKD